MKSSQGPRLADDMLTSHDAPVAQVTMKSLPVSSRRSGRRPRADGESTRARVIQAAAECILEKGYYQTSSNDIARRAGVTWGTIQYQFESREGLLLEVLNAAWNELRGQIRSAHIRGDTLEERLESLLEVLATHYSRPEYLARLQILLDLNQDPRSSATAKEAVAFHGAELNRLWLPLFQQVLGDMADDQELARYLFLTSRGYLTGNLIASSISKPSNDAAERQLLISGMAMVVRQRKRQRQKS
jgi:AcrR family transcriptional regulator